MRPVLGLVLGARGIPLADLVRPLSGWADVVVLTAEDVLAQRHDGADRSYEMVIAEDLAGLATARHPRLDGAFTVSEDAIEVTSVVAARLGLPGQPPATMPAFRDKFAQRRLLARAGVAVPPYAQLAGRWETARALAEVPLPAILKPTRGSGGALAYVVSEPAQLAALLAEATAGRARAGAAVDRDSEFILEGLLTGVPSHPVSGFAPYVSVETLASDGTYHHLAVTDRFPVSPPALETGMMLPSCLPAPVQEKVRDAAGAALAALGFRHGAAHTEVMLTAAGPRIIEVNARIGGALPYLFPMAGDVDLVEQTARVALGEAPRSTVDFQRYAVFIAPQHPVGARVESVGGLAEIAALPGVRAVLPVSVGGNAATVTSFNATMIAAVLATVAEPAEAVALWQTVMRTVAPVYAEDRVAAHHLRAPGSLSGAGPDAVVEAAPHVVRLR